MNSLIYITLVLLLAITMCSSMSLFSNSRDNYELSKKELSLQNLIVVCLVVVFLLISYLEILYLYR